MKKIISKSVFAICVLLALITFFAGCLGKTDSSQENQAGEIVQLPNPISQVESPEDFAAMNFAVVAPEAAQDISYSTISGNTAQVNFKLDNISYCYRAANDMQWQMLSGVYEEFEPKTRTVEIHKGESEKITVTVMRVKDSGEKLCYWSIGETDYTLYAADNADDDNITAVLTAIFSE